MKKWKASTARRSGAVVATAALTMGMLTVGSVSALAATVCDGDLGSEVVVGDLTVAAGGDCTLGGAHVQGNVVVEPGGWLDATSTVIDGDVTATDPYGITLDGDSVGGNVVVGSLDGGFLYLNDLTVTGNVEAIGVDVEISDSTIGGAVTTTDAPYVDLLRTSVTHDVSIAGSAFGVWVAGTVVNGTLSVTDSARAVLIGADADGNADAFGNVVGGNLVLTGNGNGTGHDTLQIAATTVLGGIVLEANDPVANFGAGNSAGSVTGDSTGEEPTAPPVADGDQSVVVVVPERNAGEFFWTIDSTSNLVNLGVAVEEGDHFAAEGALHPIRVTDTRLTGAAWSVSGQLSDFSVAGETVDGSGKYLGWTPRESDNTVGAVAGPQVDSGFLGGEGLAVSRELGSAPAGHEPGSVQLDADLDLKLPVAIGTGTYSATLTLTALS